MHNLKRLVGNNSGQSILLGVTLLTVVFMAFGATLLKLQQVSASQRAGNSFRTQARESAMEGIGFIAQQLSTSQAQWDQALGGDYTGTSCNTDSIVTSPSGNRYRLYCSSQTNNSAGLQSYQVGVWAYALGPGNSTKPLRSIRAYLSQRTAGVDTATGQHAAVAVQLTRQPDPLSGTLNVHWGPIAILDSQSSAVWSLPEPINSGRYPRKFSPGGITGTIARAASYSAGAQTDHREYWAYTSMAFPPLINETSYQEIASNNPVLTAPTRDGITAIPRFGCGVSAPTNCAVFKPAAGDTAIFDAPGNGYTVPPGTVVYVIGNAQFDRVDLTNVTFIITGNLTVTSGGGGQLQNLHVPVTAPLEYPYAPDSPTSWPCQGQEGNVSSGRIPAYDCSSTSVFPGLVSYWGFLYVKGNLIVNPAVTWNMAGTLVVGDLQVTPILSGMLYIGAGGTLNVAYDDLINRSILVNPTSGTAIKLSVDVIEEKSAS